MSWFDWLVGGFCVLLGMVLIGAWLWFTWSKMGWWSPVCFAGIAFVSSLLTRATRDL